MSGGCVKEPHYLLIMLIRCCWSVTACLIFFSPPSSCSASSHRSPAPRCQERCHNMIMRLHTFGVDSRGKKPDRWDSTGQIYRHEMTINASCSPAGEAPGRGRQRSHGAAQDARTFTHRDTGSYNELGCLVLFEFVNSYFFLLVSRSSPLILIFILRLIK